MLPMNSPITLLANSFFIAAAILGLPALAVLIIYSCYRVRVWLVPPPPPSARVKNPDAILLILEGMTRTIGAVSNVLGFFGKFVFAALAILSAGALLLAVALFFTGRGLHAQQEWARISATVIAAGVTLWGLASATAFRGFWLLLSLTLTAVGLYALRILWLGFAVPA